MDKEKMNGRELTEKELEMVSGGSPMELPTTTPTTTLTPIIINQLPTASLTELKKIIEEAAVAK